MKQSAYLRHSRRVLILLLAAALSGIFITQGGAEEFKPTESERRSLDSLKASSVTLAYSYDLAYGELPNGTRNGMLQPVLDVLENELGLTVEVRKLDWTQARTAMDRGEIDLYGPISLTESRRQKYAAIDPVFRNSAEIVTRIKDPLYSLLHVQNKKIGLLEDSILTRTVYNYVHSGGEIVYFPSLEAALDALEREEIDGFMTVDNAELEIMARPEIQLEFTIRDFHVDQGFIGKSENMASLAAIVNRYLKTKSGSGLADSVHKARNESLLRNRREHYAKEIELVRKKYPIVDMFSLGAFYPLHYTEGKGDKGLLLDVNDIFRDLTGVEIRTGRFGIEDGDTAVIMDQVREGTIHFIGGVYANTVFWDKEGFEYSIPVYTDRLRTYTYGPSDKDIRQSRVGALRHVVDFVHWDLVTDRAPELYASREALFESLKKKEIDAAFLGEMYYNYHHNVLKDYQLREFGPIVVETDIRLVCGRQHPELLRLMNESIRLYQAMYPVARMQWERLAETQRLESVLLHDRQRVWMYRVIGLFTALMLAIFLLFYYYYNYDRQIRRLLRTQQTFDLLWGNLRTGVLVSKGRYSLFGKWGLNTDHSSRSIAKRSEELGRDLRKEYVAALQRMKRENLDLVVEDEEVVTPVDGRKKHYRRYFHRLSNTRFMLCLQDITDQKQAEEQEQFLNELFGALRDGLLFLDKDLNVLRYNVAMNHLFPRFDPKKKHCYDRFRGMDAPCTECPVRDALKDGQKHSRVEYIEAADAWIEISAFPLVDPKTGETTRVLELVRDITDQHLHEEEMQQREHFLTGILNSSHDGIIAISDAEGITHFNPRLLEMFDHNPELRLGISSANVLALQAKYVKNPEVIVQTAAKLRQRREMQNGVLYLKDGRIYEWTAVAVDMGKNSAPEYVTRFWTYHDATELYRATEEIRQSEQRFRAYFDTMPSGMAMFETQRNGAGDIVDLIYLDVNPALETINELTRDEIVGKGMLELFSELRIISGPFEGENLLSFCIKALEGEPDWCMVCDEVSGVFDRISVFRTGPDRLAMYVTDETGRIESERALRESEERLRVLFESMTNGVMILDVKRDESGKPVDYIISRCNPAYARNLGSDEENLLGRSLLEAVQKLHVLSHDFGDRWWAGLDRAVEGVSGAYHIFVEGNVSPRYQEIIVFPCGENKVGLLTYDETRRIESENALRESEERHRMLFDSMTNGLLLLDVVRDEQGKPVDYIVTIANPAYAASLRRAPDDIQGRSILELLRGVDVDCLSNDFGESWWRGLETAAAGISGTYHVYVEEFHASPYMEVVIFPIGKDRVGALMYDETYRIRSEQKLRTMQLIIDHISEPVIWLFLDGTIQYGNTAATVAFGYDDVGTAPDGLIGKKVWAIDEAIAEEDWPSYVERFHREKNLSFETTLRRKDGTTFPALLLADLLERNGELFIAACFRDLSEQLRRIEAEQASLAKSKFLDHMSHEIRTPLNGVIGIADVLLGTDLQTKQKEYVELVRTSGRHLLSLVNNILDYSKLDSGELELNETEFDLPELIESVLGIMASQAAQRKLELCGLFLTDVPRHVVGDAGRLRQVLINLLSNGLKFTEHGGVKLSVSVVDRKEWGGRPCCFVRFEVADSGIGIAPEKMERLFESFTLGDASFARKYGGTGLGLVIAGELVELMHGTVEVDSTENRGSVFRFTIPLAMPTSTPRGEGLSVQNIFRHGRLELANQTAILVDENEVLLDILSDLFRSWGMNVHAFRTRVEAAGALRQAAKNKQPYRVAVIDYFLEDGPGSKLIEVMKDDPDLKETPVILLAPLAGEIDPTDENLIQNVDRFVTKPVFGSTLFNAVLGILTGTDDEPEEGLEHSVAEPFHWQAETAQAEEEPSILVVEDNRINQIVVGEILAQAGFLYDIVDNGEKACEAVTKKRYSLILMDCQMPVMDGFEATRIIRERESSGKTPRLPIIALTANAMAGDEEHCLEAGMDAFCSKPVHAEKLVEMVRRWISEHDLSEHEA